MIQDIAKMMTSKPARKTEELSLTMRDTTTKSKKVWNRTMEDSDMTGQIQIMTIIKANVVPMLTSQFWYVYHSYTEF